jgi:hypothetical protein
MGLGGRGSCGGVDRDHGFLDGHDGVEQVVQAQHDFAISREWDLLWTVVLVRCQAGREFRELVVLVERGFVEGVAGQPLQEPFELPPRPAAA